jgi:putative acetyltransferase
MNFAIRPETPTDHSNIDDLFMSCFQRDNETQIVSQIRSKSSYINELALLALAENKIVGYVLFSKVNIIGAENTLFPTVAIAPLAILPTYKDSGLEEELIKHGLKEATKLGHKLMIVSGDPIFYYELGFTLAEDADILAPFHSANDELMVLEIAENGLAPVSGTVNFPEEFYLI